MATFEIRDSIDGGFYWRQVADNGEVLSTSETYESKQSARKGINAAAATQTGHVKDLTASGSRPDDE